MLDGQKTVCRLSKSRVALTGKISFVRVVPFDNVNHQDDNLVVLNLGDYAIVTDTIAPISFGMVDQIGSVLSRVITADEVIANPIDDSYTNGFVELVNGFSGVSCVIDNVTFHAIPNVFKTSW